MMMMMDQHHEEAGATRFASDPNKVFTGGSAHDLGDLVAAATTVGVNKKKRMARQRRSSPTNLLFSCSAAAPSHVPANNSAPAARVR